MWRQYLFHPCSGNAVCELPCILIWDCFMMHYYLLRCFSVCRLILSTWICVCIGTSRPSRPSLGPTQRCIQWIPRGFFPGGGGGVQRSGRDDHSPPSGTEVMNDWSSTPLIRLRSVDGDNFTFYSHVCLYMAQLSSVINT